ncbi:MAG: response regulator [Saprospiraceae bacterium]
MKNTILPLEIKLTNYQLKKLANTKILIIEDDPLIAEDLADLVERADYQVVGIAYKAESAFKLLRTTSPDLILLDINLNSELSGIDLAHFINKNYQIPFIYVTSFSDRDTIERVRETHPMGYLVKPFNEQSLYTTLEIALANFAQFQRVDKLQLSLENLNQKLLAPITEREFATLELLLKGKSNKQIANELYVSPNTVKTHVSNIFSKLEVDSRSKAILHVNQMFVN